ncbi:MAG TPA: cyclopropane-fatty-acyl-phospholipid synthase family protein [Longimicrobiaceae bacterium]|nr:cyclopropane-fatty-acyl-phospholipid synthase family protein [Longimicrobiaceae bacterium]
MHEVTATVTPVAADEAVRRTAAFLDVVFPPPRDFSIRLWSGDLLPARGASRFTLVLRTPGSLRRMFRVPVELSLGEAYLRGDFDVEGDLVAAFSLARTAHRIAQSPGAAMALVRGWFGLPRGEAGESIAARGPALLHGHEHSRERDRAAIQYHYDVGNDFYQLFLDGRMIYSCAYFPTGAEDIDAAQEAKLEHICRKLRLREGERLLDIGCGWGGLLIYAAQRFGIEGVGVTLSNEQHRLANERIREAGLESRLRVEKRDYRDLGDESFDKIVSVGMFEHVGRSRFSEYFTHVFRLLRPGGIFLNHAIASRPEPVRRGLGGIIARTLDQALVGNETFRKRYIFPDGELAPVSIANTVAEMAGFEVRDLENLREHYALTLRRWLARLRERRADAVASAGLPLFRLWEMYLAGSIYHFETAMININQTLFAKPIESGRVDLPRTRADLYVSA